MELQQVAREDSWVLIMKVKRSERKNFFVAPSIHSCYKLFIVDWRTNLWCFRLIKIRIFISFTLDGDSLHVLNVFFLNPMEAGDARRIKSNLKSFILNITLSLQMK